MTGGALGAHHGRTGYDSGGSPMRLLIERTSDGNVTDYYATLVDDDGTALYDHHAATVTADGLAVLFDTDGEQAAIRDDNPDDRTMRVGIMLLLAPDDDPALAEYRAAQAERRTS